MIAWARESDLSKPLYKDHRGMHVAFDVEAPVRMVEWSCSAEVVAIVDGVEGQLRKGLTARESLTVCCAGEFASFRAKWLETFYGEAPPGASAKAVLFGVERETDSVDVSDKDSRKAHRLTVQNESEVYSLTSPFGKKKLAALHVMHLNRMEIDVAIGDGLVALRRLYDRFHGRQRARVLVDGDMAGWWYTPEEDRKTRWAESDFYVNPKLTRGKKTLRIAIDPPAGTPLWSVSHYGILDLGKL